MPTYEYLCDKCGHHFDLFQSMKDDAITQCPKDKCAQKKWGHGRVKKQVSAGAGLLFKGTGFYITDYRSEGYKAAAKKDAAGGATSSGSGGGDSKPAAKTETKSESKPDKGAKPAKAKTTP